MTEKEIDVLIEDYIQIGDWLSPDMDTVLDKMRMETGVDYKYKNLYSRCGGFLAKVTIWKEGIKDKVVAFIEGSDLGHFVENVEVI